MNTVDNSLPYHSINQKNYTKHSSEFEKLEQLTSYLVYRDIEFLLLKYLLKNRSKNQPIKILDIGCSVGTSIIHFSQVIQSHGFKTDITGIDLNEATLAKASARLPHVKFKQVAIEDSLEELGQFHLIICNFVLVEMPNKEMKVLLKKAQRLLQEDAIMVVTNPTIFAYCTEYKWYSLNNQFLNNQPGIPPCAKKPRGEFAEDQPVTLQIIDPQTQKEIVTFHDFLHTQASYDGAYCAAELSLLERHCPLGKLEDNIPWLTETKISRMQIDILKKKNTYIDLKLNE